MILHWMAVSLLAITLFVAAVAPFTGSVSRLQLGITLAMLVGEVVLIVAVRRGRIFAASVGVTVTCWLSGMPSLLLIEGVVSQALGAFFVTLVLAEALLGARWVLGFGVATMTTYVLAFVLETQGLLVPDPPLLAVRLGSHLAQVGFVSIVLTVTTRALRQALASLAERERELSASRERYEALFEHSPAGIALLDEQGSVHLVNAQVEALTGLTRAELVGQSLPLPQHRHARAESRGDGMMSVSDAGLAGEAFRQIMTEGDAVPLVITLQRQNGSERIVEVSGVRVQQPPGVLATLVDITERERAREEREALQAHRAHTHHLESLGRLAGGVAHDFNNLLTVIRGASDLIAEVEGLPAESHDDLSDLRQASDSAIALTRQLLAFGRQQPLHRRVVDGVEVVRGFARMAEHLIDERITLEVQTPDDPVHVLADPAEVERVLVNLLVNARDALPDGGRVVLSVVREAGDVGWVAFSVRDDGVGMDAQTAERALEPFFTTKALGRGTGLGLATVHGVVVQLGGTVSLQSEVGRGTCVTVRLPSVDASDDSVRHPASPQVEAQERAAFILLIEDEERVRAVLRRVLERGGHRVHAVSGLDEAMSAETQQHTFDLVISDVVLKDGYGPDLVRELRGAGYGGRVLYVTGYAGDALDGVDLGDDDVLTKPLDPAELLVRVAKLSG